MQAPIAQVIALTTHGNAFLAGSPNFSPSNFYPANTTFRFCEYVRFMDLKRKWRGWKESEYAPDPNAWLAQLKRDGAHGLRMSYGSSGGRKSGGAKIADRMLVGLVGGGGRWMMEAMKPTGSDWWEGRWEVGDRERKDQKIWRVSYGRVSREQPAADHPAVDLPALRDRLAGTLKAIGDFARKHKLDNFANAFDGGLAQLSADDPQKNVYQSDLAPETLPLPARQLLAAVQAAWVFGGMGSWNDIGFEVEDQVLYDRLSEELYQLLNAATVAAANAGAPSGK